MKGSFQLWLILVLALQTSDYWGFKESKYQNLGRNSQHSKAFNFFRQISKFVQIRGIFATRRGSPTVGDRCKESSASPEGGEHKDRYCICIVYTICVRLTVSKFQILECHIAQSGFLVLGPIEINVRKCVFPKHVPLPLELDPPPRPPPHPVISMGENEIWF